MTREAVWVTGGGSWEEGLSREAEAMLLGHLVGMPDRQLCRKDWTHPGSSRPEVDLQTHRMHEIMQDSL